MNVTDKPTDPATICLGDKAKLLALYTRLCPEDILASDDPRRDSIVAEILDIGLAPNADAALQVIAWWDPVADNLKPMVAGVRRSFGRMKLEGRYSTA